MNTETIKPIESPEKIIPERMLCWTCRQRPRTVVFPPGGGSFLDVNCERCQRATEVLKRLEGQT